MGNPIFFIITFVTIATFASCDNQYAEPTFNHSKIIVTFGGDIEEMEQYGSFSISAWNSTDLYINDSLITNYSTEGHGTPRDSLVFGIVWNAASKTCGVNCTLNFVKIVEDKCDEHISCRLRKYTNGIMDMDTTLVIYAIKESQLNELPSPVIPTKWVSHSLSL